MVNTSLSLLFHIQFQVQLQSRIMHTLKGCHFSMEVKGKDGEYEWIFSASMPQTFFQLKISYLLLHLYLWLNCRAQHWSYLRNTVLCLNTVCVFKWKQIFMSTNVFGISKILRKKSFLPLSLPPFLLSLISIFLQKLWQLLFLLLLKPHIKKEKESLIWRHI